MAQTALAAEVRSVLDALKRHIATIEANTSNPKVLDATYELENIVMQMWPGEQDIAACADRWRTYGLSPLHSRIADMLHSRMGKTVSRSQLMSCWTMVGKEEPNGGEKDLDVAICKMRRKIEKSPYVIMTQYGAGFRMELKPT